MWFLNVSITLTHRIYREKNNAYGSKDFRGSVPQMWNFKFSSINHQSIKVLTHWMKMCGDMMMMSLTTKRVFFGSKMEMNKNCFTKTSFLGGAEKRGHNVLWVKEVQTPSQKDQYIRTTRPRSRGKSTRPGSTVGNGGGGGGLPDHFT